MDEKRKDDDQKSPPEHTGEQTRTNGPANDGAVGGSGGFGGGQSSLTAAGNEKVPPKR